MVTPHTGSAIAKSSNWLDRVGPMPPGSAQITRYVTIPGAEFP